MFKDLAPLCESRAVRELIERGRQEGITEGFLKGVEQGQMLVTRGIVHRLREDGVEVEEISRIVDRSVETVESMLQAVKGYS